MIHHVLISAHRGGTETAPGGSMEAFLDAIAIGADYVEFDVHRTRDGELVVYHDKRAERRGVRPAAMTRAQLCDEVGHQVLDARDVLGTIGGRAKAHIDVKAPGYEEEIVGVAIDLMPLDGFLITGTDSVVKTVKEHAPEVRCALSVGRGWHEVPWSQMVQTRRSELNPVRRVRACSADAAAMHYALARFGALAACAREGIDAMVWTVNDSGLIQSFLDDARVGVLVTDRPRLAMSLRSATGGSAR